MANNELLLFTQNFINQNTFAHEQSHYFDGEAEVPNPGMNEATVNICGSTGCVAGWGSLFGGWHQVMEVGPAILNVNGKVLIPQGYVGTEKVVDETGRELHMMDAAEESFGITDRQATALFNGGNSIEQINDIIDAIVADPNADVRTLQAGAENCYCEDCNYSEL